MIENKCKVPDKSTRYSQEYFQVSKACYCVHFSYALWPTSFPYSTKRLVEPSDACHIVNSQLKTVNIIVNYGNEDDLLVYL